MTARKRPKELQKRGRKTLYRKEYAEQAYKLCLLGMTRKEMAAYFEIAEATLDNWCARHPEFLEALKDGRENADAKVAQSLYRRACGYEHPEDKIFQYEGSPIVVPTIKHYPPDTGAATLWLKNRQPEKWRDKQDVEVSGGISVLASKPDKEL